MITGVLWMAAFFQVTGVSEGKSPNSTAWNCISLGSCRINVECKDLGDVYFSIEDQYPYSNGGKFSYLKFEVFQILKRHENLACPPGVSNPNLPTKIVRLLPNQFTSFSGRVKLPKRYELVEKIPVEFKNAARIAAQKDCENSLKVVKEEIEACE